MKAALTLWVFAGVLFATLLPSGVYSLKEYITYSILGLVNLLISGSIGAKLYSEPAP